MNIEDIFKFIDSTRIVRLRNKCLKMFPHAFGGTRLYVRPAVHGRDYTFPSHLANDALVVVWKFTEQGVRANSCLSFYPCGGQCTSTTAEYELTTGSRTQVRVCQSSCFDSPVQKPVMFWTGKHAIGVSTPYMRMLTDPGYRRQLFGIPVDEKYSFDINIYDTHPYVLGSIHEAYCKSHGLSIMKDDGYPNDSLRICSLTNGEKFGAIFTGESIIRIGKMGAAREHERLHPEYDESKRISDPSRLDSQVFSPKQVKKTTLDNNDNLVREIDIDTFNLTHVEIPPGKMLVVDSVGNHHIEPMDEDIFKDQFRIVSYPQVQKKEKKQDDNDGSSSLFTMADIAAVIDVTASNLFLDKCLRKINAVGQTIIHGLFVHLERNAEMMVFDRVAIAETVRRLVTHTVIGVLNKAAMLGMNIVFDGVGWILGATSLLDLLEYVGDPLKMNTLIFSDAFLRQIAAEQVRRGGITEVTPEMIAMLCYNIHPEYDIKQLRQALLSANRDLIAVQQRFATRYKPHRTGSDQHHVPTLPYNRLLSLMVYSGSAISLLYAAKLQEFNFVLVFAMYIITTLIIIYRTSTDREDAWWTVPSYIY